MEHSSSLSVTPIFRDSVIKSRPVIERRIAESRKDESAELLDGFVGNSPGLSVLPLFDANGSVLMIG